MMSLPKPRKSLPGGGKPVGDLVLRVIPGLGRITFPYITDPDGNILEIQTVEENDDHDIA